MPHIAKAQEKLRSLMNRCRDGELSCDEFRQAMGPVIVAAVSCNRFSAWLHRDTGRLHCLDRVSLCDPRGDAGWTSLDSTDHPGYFSALHRTGVITAHDAMSHPALESLREGYLVPLDIRSLLDVAFSINGKRCGLLCCENRGEPVRWSSSDIAFVRWAGAQTALFVADMREAE